MVFWSNDLEMTSLAYGLLLGAVGAGLTSFGLSIWASIAYTARNARELLGSKGQEVQAKVLGKELSPKDVQLPQQLPQHADQSYAFTRTFYLVSYVFDAVRADGVTCRVEVRQRKVPSSVWKGLTEGDAVAVRCLSDEPRRCRITKAAEHETKGFMAMRLRAAVAFIFIALGIVAAVLSVLDHHVAGIILWGVVVFFSALWQLTGRRLLKALCPCFGKLSQRPWSPLFMHAGYVLCKELGKDVEPSSEPEPVLPKDVEILTFSV